MRAARSGRGAFDLVADVALHGALGDTENWAADQVRFTGAWVRGGAGRQAVVVLVHAVTAPRTSWRIIRAPAAETQAPAPVRDPDWVANRTRADKGGTP